MRRALATVCVTVVFWFLQPSVQAQSPEFANEELAWRAQHAADLQKPDGWLSLIGLEWLSPGNTTVGSASDNKIHLPQSAAAHVAVLQLDQGSIKLLAPKEGFPSTLYVDGKPAAEQTLHVYPEKDKLNSHFVYGTVSFYPIRRADRYAVRVKDSLSPSLVGFHGLKWFEPSASYRVTAKWVPYDSPKTISLLTLVGTSYDASVPGYVEFSLLDKTYRLEPVLEDPQSTKLFFIMKDSTSADTTYPACRFLYTPLPSNGVAQPGELLLDFNHLENPPCAYTPYATCPLPPTGNRLPIALPVGEQRYHN